MGRVRNRNNSVSIAIASYRTLIEQLLRDEISPADFESLYFPAWAACDVRMTRKVFKVVNKFFNVVEDYVDDPRLRRVEDGDLGPEQLKAGARELLERADRETAGRRRKRSAASSSDAGRASDRSEGAFERTSDPVEYLIEEIREEFAAWRVGLYMFPACLVSQYPDMPWAERVRHSAAALKVLLETGEARLVWEVWADLQASRPADGVTPTEHDWEWPAEGPAEVDKPYLAIRPNDSAS